MTEFHQGTTSQAYHQNMPGRRVMQQKPHHVTRIGKHQIVWCIQIHDALHAGLAEIQKSQVLIVINERLTLMCNVQLFQLPDMPLITE
ncbi:hypothetical protein [Undibacterium sp. TS12]|uniref:hypothetical protein n=1 Tax=Undibacterium sp. TS12 TaxID=2908202 RepID=UPI001F4C62E2|nr:hypothetical protein [Undibacterium sp. TS12]MCH8619420.1 hypothetical protein [Undibacterium sp. TS12]